MSDIEVIITINDNANFGNRLQNYALSTLIANYNTPMTALLVPNANSLAKFLFLPIYRSMRHAYLDLFRKSDGKGNYYRGYCFTREFIPTGKFYISQAKQIMGKNNTRIGHYIIGSDQVWNYQWISDEDLALRLGSFVSDDVPIISYAASFGVSDVSEEVWPIFQKYLPRFKAISVREDRGAELVRKMTGLNADVVLDPTLMLGAEKWKEITRGFVPNDDRYVLTYFLGKPSAEQERTIQNYAKTKRCRVRRILDLRDKETFVAGPQDFVELFSKAQYVFTDSYHACCFSILYHKQFTVFNRIGMEGKANMNSRMETLFRLFNLDNVVIDNGLAPQIDYQKVDQLLTKHRVESQTWLDNAMTEG